MTSICSKKHNHPCKVFVTAFGQNFASVVVIIADKDVVESYPHDTKLIFKRFRELYQS